MFGIKTLNGSLLNGLVLIGPPACGKGVQAELLASFINKQGFKAQSLSIGELLRREISKKTSLGLKVETFVDKGLLVPDEIVALIIEKRLKRFFKKNVFWILDGYPRTLKQARLLQFITSKHGQVYKAVFIDITFETSFDRVVMRRVCPKCGRVYNLKTKKPLKDNVCDVCGVRLVKRKDDNALKLKQRWKSFENETMPVIVTYNRLGLLVKVDGELSIKSIHKQILKSLKLG